MSRIPFATGAISQLFLVISAFSSMTLGDFSKWISSRNCWSGATLFPNAFLVFGTYASSLLLVSAFLLLISLATIASHLRISRRIVLGPVLLLLAAANEIFMFTTGFRPFPYYSSGYGVFYAATQGMLILVSGWQALLTAAMIIVGVFFKRNRERSSSPDLWTATGVTYLTLGSCVLILFMLSPTIAWLLIAFCGVMGMGCFLMSGSAIE